MGVAPPPPEASGMFVRSYYSFIHDDDILVSKPAGALKAFYLQSCLSALRNDLLMLQRLRNPHLVAPVGLQFCPPCLVLEASPFGSLHSWMRRLRRKMGRVDTHHIALQVRGSQHSYSCPFSLPRLSLSPLSSQPLISFLISFPLPLPSFSLIFLQNSTSSPNNYSLLLFLVQGAAEAMWLGQIKEAFLVQGAAEAMWLGQIKGAFLVQGAAEAMWLGQIKEAFLVQGAAEAMWLGQIKEAFLVQGAAEAMWLGQIKGAFLFYLHQGHIRSTYLYKKITFRKKLTNLILHFFSCICKSLSADI